MALTFGNGPYYNDYSAASDHYAVLARPGYALQARELNVLQSILEEQIRRFGKHIFRDGSMVIPGQITMDQNVQYVKINPTYESSPVAWDLIDPKSEVNAGSFVEIQGNTSGVKARVIAVDQDNEVIYIKYVSSGTDNETAIIQDDEEINLLPLNSGVAQAIIEEATGITSAAAINDGVYFIFGRFLSVSSQYIILEPFNPNPTIRVGLKAVETIITPEDDLSLTDNAAGTPNYAAPGSHRYKITLQLITKDVTDTDDENFFELLRVDAGVIQRIVDKTLYSEIEKMIARRMEDTNGSFCVRPFKFSVREHLKSGNNGGLLTEEQGGDESKLSIDIQPGKAYVFGHEIETIVTTHVNMDKGRDTAYFGNSRVRAFLGNYFYANRLFCFPDYDSLPLIDLYDIAITTDGVLPVVPSIGRATVRGVQFHQGSFGEIGDPGPIFKVFVTNIQMDPGRTLTDIRSFAVGDGTLTSTANILHELDLTNVNGDFSIGTTITQVGTANEETVYAWNTDTNFILTQPDDGSIIETNAPITSDADGTATNALRTVIFETQKNFLIFPLPQSGVATVRDKVGDVSTTYSYRKTFTPVAEALNRVTFAVGTNEVFDSMSTQDYLATIETGDDAGKLIDVATANPAFGSSLTQLTFDAPTGTTIKLSATVVKQFATERTKTLQSTSLGIPSSVPSVINLEKCDVFNYQVFEGSDDTGTNISDRYIFDNGQRDNYYDFGTLTLKPGAVTPSEVFVTFLYFEHGAGDYFCVDSYRNFGSFDSWYSVIPSFTSPTTGQTFPLANYLDFRSKRDESDLVNLIFPSSVGKLVKPNDDIITDFSYYLGRVDKLYLDGDGFFRIIRGNSAIAPLPPSDPKDGMVLATFRLGPYTFSKRDVQVKVIDNRRYTMRDIGKLEERINNLEYYVALNLLEQDTQSFLIPDATTGLDRFKNGFVVDPFSDQRIADVGNADCRFSIDSGKKELHPMFNSDSFGMEFNLTQSTNIEYQDIKDDSDIISLPYTEVPIITQLRASGTENVNPYNVFTFLGSLIMDPATDTWKDTENKPDVLVEDNSQYDAVIASMGGQNGNGVVWNDWVTDWVGVDKETTSSSMTSKAFVGPPHIQPQVGDILDSGILLTADNIDYYTPFILGINTTPVPGYYYDGMVTTPGTQTTATTVTTTSTKQSRKGIETNIVLGPAKTTINDKIVSVSLEPWIRTITVQWYAKRLKPNTRHYLFFDDLAVSSNSTPDPIITDATGAVSGTFTIPEKTFRVGRRVFRICDDSLNRLTIVTSSAETQYNASGLLETHQKTITSTREAIIQKQIVTDTRVITTSNTTSTTTGTTGEGQDIPINWYDPLAQSFLVGTLNGGYFATGIDLYFRTKDDSIPVTLQLREMENGIPTQRIIPFSEIVLDAADVNISDDATEATQFKFSSPVYLQNNQEYAIVVISNSDLYTLWIAKIGDLEVNTDNLISVTPYAGSMFKSKNASTWTPEQTESFKFVMYRAKFDTSVTGKAYFQNPVLNSRTLPSLRLYTHEDTNVIRVYHRNHGMPTGSKVTITIPPGPEVLGGFQNWVESYNGIPVADIVPTESGDLRTGSQPSGVADTVVGSRTYTVGNVELDSYTISIVDGSNADVNADDSGYTGISLTVTENRLVDVMLPHIEQIQLANTAINWYYRGVLGQSTHGTQSPYERELGGSFPYQPMVPNQNLFFDAPRIVASQINETEMIDLGSTFANKSLVYYAEMTSTLDNLSPIIDVQRIAAIVITNRIDNRTSDSVPSASPLDAAPLYTPEISAKGATAPHRYIHRPAVLQSASNSLHVIVSVMRPAEATVEVWYRVLPVDTNDKLEDTEWSPMFAADGGSFTSDFSAARNPSDFKDYYYAAEDIGKYIAFQTKIVTRSSNSSRVAICKEFRAIALDT